MRISKASEILYQFNEALRPKTESERHASVIFALIIAGLGVIILALRLV